MKAGGSEAWTSGGHHHSSGVEQTEGTQPPRREPSIDTRGQATLGARNQFKGEIKSIKLGGVMALVVVTPSSPEIVSAITRSFAKSLDLKPGDEVKTIVKSRC
jgi:molybdopterin-binding protein